jgi:hypothetical protein
MIRSVVCGQDFSQMGHVLRHRASHLEHLLINKYLFPLLQPSAGSKVKPLTYDQRYDNELLGQGCSTTHGTVMGRNGEVM